MSKYLVEFWNKGPYGKRPEKTGETSVSCFREDVEDVAITAYAQEYGRDPVYTHIEVEQVK